MPIVFIVGVLCLFLGFGGIGWQNHEYKVRQARQSMPLNTTLPTFMNGATDRGKLTLKNIIVSPDRKHMAVSIAYDDDAHKQLSAFGNKYRLWLVTPQGYPIKGMSVKYGFFGTDGNGVLRIDSTVPMKNQAFAIILIDKGRLITSDDLNSTSTVTDTDINQSITAQLATGSTSDGAAVTTTDQSSSKSGASSLPMYYVRLNPYSAKVVHTDWTSERALVETLFVKKNLRTIKKQMQENKTKKKLAKRTLAEYNARLKVNPQDKTALDGKEDIENAIKSLDQTIASQQKNYDTLSKARFGNNILGKEQTKSHKMTTKDMAYFGNNGSQSTTTD